MTASIFGKSIGFPFRIDGAGRIGWSDGEENVRESIAVILRTDRLERIALPDFGAGLQRWLFAPNTPDTHARIAHAVEQALRRWEPRIALEEVTVAASPDNSTQAIATITYRLVASGQRNRLSVGISLSTAPN
ncbi:GPW/gp25 family protein [Erythrobacter oryzae]|uniref:GPW/gp25 family protein n=1 Tax=Erythrobacter oryzae TaxID=3019556 RepID=UPI00255531D0|nr:GPW/gp25 family protein [Erythrobacter sp. COR-2]